MDVSIQNWFQNQDLTKGQATQLRIIQSALQLFSQKGVANVTLQMIAENSNTSHPLILKHFGSKDELLLRVRHYVSMSNHTWVDSKIKPQMTARECLFTHCYENLRWAFEKPAEGKIILLTHYYNSLSTYQENASSVARKKGSSRILKYVLQADREGELKSKEKPELLAEMAQEFLIGLGVALLTSAQLHNRKIPPTFKKKVDLFLDSFLK